MSGQTIRKADQHGGLRSRQTFNVIEASLCPRHRCQNRRDAFPIGSKARRALVPSIASEPQSARGIELHLDLLDERIDFFRTFTAQLSIAVADGREHAFNSTDIC